MREVTPKRECHFYIQSPPAFVIWVLTKDHSTPKDKRLSVSPGYSDLHAPTNLEYSIPNFRMPFCLKHITPQAEDILRQYAKRHNVPNFRPNLTLNHGKIIFEEKNSEVYYRRPSEVLGYIAESFHKMQIPHTLIFESPTPVVIEDDSSFSQTFAELLKRIPQITRELTPSKLVRKFSLF